MYQNSTELLLFLILRYLAKLVHNKNQTIEMISILAIIKTPVLDSSRV